MTFRGEPFAFDGPAAALQAMVARMQAVPTRWPAERVPLVQARGRFLAVEARADRDNPPFDQSVLDGYAVRATDAAPGAELPVVGESRIGQPPPSMPAGPCAIRVATGSAVPQGATAVIGREHVEERLAAPDRGQIRIRQGGRPLRTGESIRPQGENLRSGASLLHAGCVLGPAQLGALATVGVDPAPVAARVSVHLLATGEELVPANAQPGPFGTRDSNTPTVSSLLGARPWLHVDRADGLRGEPEELDAAIAQAAGVAHALVVMGGVSMGHRDPLRAAVERAGAEILFHGLPQRPGKPMLAALLARPDGPPLAILGLPGNPVSAAVTAERLAVPTLAAMARGRLPNPPAVATEPDDRTLDLWWHRLVRLDAEGVARLVESRGSGDVPSAAASDGFIEVPPGLRLDGTRRVRFHAWPA